MPRRKGATKKATARAEGVNGVSGNLSPAADKTFVMSKESELDEPDENEASSHDRMRKADGDSKKNMKKVDVDRRRTYVVTKTSTKMEPVAKEGMQDPETKQAEGGDTTADTKQNVKPADKAESPTRKRRHKKKVADVPEVDETLKTKDDKHDAVEQEDILVPDTVPGRRRRGRPRKVKSTQEKVNMKTTVSADMPDVCEEGEGESETDGTSSSVAQHAGVSENVEKQMGKTSNRGKGKPSSSATTEERRTTSEEEKRTKKTKKTASKKDKEEEKRPAKKARLVDENEAAVTSAQTQASKTQLVGPDSNPEKQWSLSGGFPAIGNKFVGAHTSISGGLENAVAEAAQIHARAFGMFLRSSRQWACKPLTGKAIEKFKDAMKEHGYSPDMVVPHGSYLMNCGSPKAELLEKSRATLVDELQRCEQLGLKMFNFHPGSTCGEISVEDCIERIAESINLAHQSTQYVITVIENMCRQGHTIGGRFEELRGIIDHVKDKSRIGVCLDTCHAFAAGFDLRTDAGYEKMMSDFTNIIGLDYLRAVHINDSEGDCGCHKDRHDNIGQGKMKLVSFRRVMNDQRFDNIPFVLETPEIDYSKEIRKLYSLVDPISKE